MSRSHSSGALRQTGQLAISSDETVAVPKIPRYLSVNGLTTRRKLSASTGNIHGYRAEDYKQLNWPLPKMFGQEKYGYSLIDIDDPRFLKECAGNSKKLIRLNYDEQIVDLEWRKTYKLLRDAEHRMATAGSNDKTKEMLKKEVQGHLKYLLELQELRMTLENHTKDRIPADAAFWKTKFNYSMKG